MIKKVKPIPHGHHSITPYLIVSDAHDALHYYNVAFNAEELTRLVTLDGKIAHAEILIGDSQVMLADEFPQMNIFSPTTFGGTAVTLNFYVEDVDAVFQRAVDAGGKIFRPLQNHIYGDRSATIVDPFGHQWTIATHIEDVTADEIEKRFLNFKKD